MFQFQQFKIEQRNAAMKVGTDGVLLGAWTPVNDQINRVLDVGTGTGLVALMLAQRCPKAYIDAVEIDALSVWDAQKNFENSLWAERLHIENITFQKFSRQSQLNFDLIVCNPPFFSNSIQNKCDRKATARHNHSLNQDDLIYGALKLLSANGALSVILPISDYENFRMKTARLGMYEHCRLLVKPTPSKPVKRVVALWKKNFSHDFKSEEMVLEITRHQYSDYFRKITDAFYLKK
jgi:tRNA1Val (adenine37-N6)-methyltransferase